MLEPPMWRGPFLVRITQRMGSAGRKFYVGEVCAPQAPHPLPTSPRLKPWVRQNRESVTLPPERWRDHLPLCLKKHDKNQVKVGTASHFDNFVVFMRGKSRLWLSQLG